MNKNTIISGNCQEEMSIIPNDSVELILTDIPYDGVNRKSNGLRNLDKQDADVITFNLDNFVKDCVRITKGSCYIFCGWEQISNIISIIREYGLSNRLCCWKKTNPSPMNGQSIWLSGAEYCVYFKKPNATFNEHCKNCVWEFPSGRGKVHPTEKPLSLFEYLIKVSSNENDLVFDPCIGSGTTAVAAKKLNRNYLGIELNPEYVKLAEERLNNLTPHKKVIKLKD
jgi:site-specific DNA-methyltransferase (adenine-specific)